MNRVKCAMLLMDKSDEKRKKMVKVVSCSVVMCLFMMIDCESCHC